MKKALFLVFIFCYTQVLSQSGTPDNNFDGDGKLQIAVGNGLYTPIGLPKSIIVQPDGKIVTCATVINGANYDFTIFRFNANGTPDNSFDGDGKVFTNFTVNDYVFRIALQTDGKIVAAGYTVNASNAWDIAVARYNSDGSPDNSFDGDGKVTTNISGGNEFALGVAIQTDGKIVVAGMDEAVGSGNSVIVRYDANGGLDNTFSGDGIASITTFLTRDYIYDMKLQSDGKIVCLSFNEYQSSPSLYQCILSRFTITGTLDNTLDGDGIMLFGPLAFPFLDIRPYCFTIQNDGKIVIAGFTDNGGSFSFFIARFSSTGLPDLSFSTIGYRIVGNGLGLYLFDVIQQQNGSLLAAGSNGFNSFYIHKFNSDGTDDVGFNGTGSNTIHFAAGSPVESAQGMCIQTDSKILLVGMVENGAVFDLALMRLNNAASITPVSWESFSVQKTSSGHQLNWVTNNEQSNKGFEVQRSTDGKNFSDIGFVAGSGSTQLVKHYQFTDNAPVPGNNFYRLKQVDENGKYEYSVVRKISFDKVFKMSVYPNPVTDNVVIQSNKKLIAIKLFDAQGKAILTRSNQLSQTEIISMRKFVAGSYLLQMTTTDGEVKSQLIIKK